MTTTTKLSPNPSLQARALLDAALSDDSASVADAPVDVTGHGGNPVKATAADANAYRAASSADTAMGATSSDSASVQGQADCAHVDSGPDSSASSAHAMPCGPRSSNKSRSTSCGDPVLAAGMLLAFLSVWSFCAFRLYKLKRARALAISQPQSSKQATGALRSRAAAAPEAAHAVELTQTPRSADSNSVSGGTKA